MESKNKRMTRNKIWKRMNHAWVWMKRIRHRCGYGVHSPFAFDFITNVVYERTPYYAYSELEERLGAKEGAEEVPRKVRRLLFRLVNRTLPNFLLYVGPDSEAIPFLKAPRRALKLVRVEPQAEWKPQGAPLDMAVLDVGQLKEVLPAWWERWKPALHEHSVLVIRGVGEGKDNREAWQWLRERPETGVAFDLYDLGIVFMDGALVKQHYVVNF